MSNEGKFDDVGFVVIGRNEGQRLVDSLKSILSVSDRVIYADSGSTDGSPATAESLGAKSVTVEGKPMSAARGRNAGFAAFRISHPECKYVQFVDGDCIVMPGWIDTARRFLIDNPGIAIACGRRFEAKPEASFYNRVIDGEWNTPVGQAESCGGDALVRVDAFEQVGGFRSDMIAGEEPEMCSRLREAGWQIWRLDAPMTRHDAAIHRLSQWMRRASRSGFGYVQVWKATAGSPGQLYGREIQSAIAWGVLLPLIIAAIALVAGEPMVLLAIPAAYALQIARIAARKGIGSSFSWKYAALVMTAKLGEAWGVLKYYLSKRSNQRFDYKQPLPAGRPAA